MSDPTDLHLTPEEPFEPELAEGFALSDEDAALLDAWLAQRQMGAEAGPLPHGGGERLAQIESLGRLLDVIGMDAQTPNEQEDEAAIGSLLARIDKQRELEAEAPVTPLCPADAAALDAVLTGGGGAGPVPPGLGERAAKVRGVLSVLDALRGDEESNEDEQAEALVAKTVQAAADARQRERFAEQVQMFTQQRPSLGVGLRQVATAAAVFLLAASLLLPVLDRSRDDAQRLACTASLATSGTAMSRYAADYDGVLPRGPSVAGDPWTHVGQPTAVASDGNFQSNSAHLYIMIRTGHIDPGHLACPTNAYATDSPIALGQIDWRSPEAVSYSYQNQYTPNVIRVDTSKTDFAILADKNPLFVVKDGKVVFDQNRSLNAASPGHNSQGQNILLLDGSAKWTLKPQVGKDHVWIIQGKTTGYTGTEHPDEAGTDSFLVP